MQRIQLIDDLDGESPAARSLKIVWDGEPMELDLSQQHIADWEQTIQPLRQAWLKRAEFQPAPREKTAKIPKYMAPTHPKRTVLPEKAHNRLIRDWANKHGYKVAPRGAIAQHIRDEYERRNGNATA